MTFRQTHGSAELDEDAVKLITLDCDPGPSFILIPCSVCGGDGSFDESGDRWRKCCACDGTGEVEVGLMEDLDRGLESEERLMSGDQGRDALFAQLRDLTKRWNIYEDIPESQQKECRSIGRKLHALGREPLMREAYYDATGDNRAASVLAAYWDGIGDWQW
jgi:hypothetical protein